MYSSQQAHVARAREREVQTAEKATTQKDIQRPSQNPQLWAEAATLKDDLNIRNTVAENVNVAVRTMTAIENVFQTVQEHVQRFHEIAIGAAGKDGTSDAARKFGLSEAKHLYESLLSAVNTKYANKSLFAGYKTDGPAFDHEGNYMGDGNQQEIEIDRGVKLSMGVEGSKAILGQGMLDGVDILKSCKTLVDAMEADNADGVFASISDLYKSIDQVSTFRAELAGRLNRLDRQLEDHAEKTIQTTDHVSKIEDADAVKVFSDLARDQTILKAAVSTTQKVLSETPADILFK